MSAEHSDVMSNEESENKAKDVIQARANAVVRSAELADVYYEKISRESGSGTIDRYDVWVLIKLPRAEIEKERARQADEAKTTVRTSLARLREAQVHEKAGNVLAGLIRYREVVSQMKVAEQSVETGDAELANAGRLRQVAQVAANGVQSNTRRAVLV